MNSWKETCSVLCVCREEQVCFFDTGATYQILPRHELQTGVRRPSNYRVRSRYIIAWLATADLMASSAVLVRAISWIVAKNLLIPTTSVSFDTFFCTVSSGWIQYFYTATCLWTLCYAVDVFKVFNERSGVPKLYHAICWGLPALLTAAGLAILYTPDLNCHSMLTNPFRRILPNYIFTYLPILTVMLVNPILYWRTSHAAEQLLVSVSGRFTENERTHLRNLKLKFLCINLVFYLCWIPNIINGFMLWILWGDLPKGFVLFDWYLMATFNPLQACFNAMVYRKWGDTNTVVIYPWTRHPSSPTISEDSDESSYLLNSNSSSSNSDDVDPDVFFRSGTYGSL
ncbi:G-protein coupled receptor 143 isoform X2 [Folsomia candida]|uniref:G-protein coupled receptor 143 isoform X2 n=1 Tax=Folsomia candida TaxID=158441 RepID=UPI0016053F25|nr:G-protein coupled receptor 143 isoform X2 [Folsomia candida]